MKINDKSVSWINILLEIFVVLAGIGIAVLLLAAYASL